MAGFWDEFTHDPRAPQHAHLRASDQDRDIVVKALGAAYADGRLTHEEFDERAGQVTASRTLAELPPVVADLVSPTSGLVREPNLRAQAERRYDTARRQALLRFLTPSLITITIWAALLLGGGGTTFPWPIFVVIGTGMRYAQLVTGREDSIAAYQRSIERKQRRQLGR